MSAVYEPKLVLPVGAVAADAFDFSGAAIPPADFVVSRRRDGTVASRYADLSWDLSAYHPEGRTRKLHFAYWAPAEGTPDQLRFSEDARWLLFMLMWLRDGAPLSVNTLAGYLGCVLALARFCEGRFHRMTDVFQDGPALVEFANQPHGAGVTEGLGALLTFLAKVPSFRRGFELAGRSAWKKINGIAQQQRALQRQHPPIPTRLYSQVLSTLQSELVDWAAVADASLALAVRCAVDVRIGRKVDKQREIA